MSASRLRNWQIWFLSKILDQDKCEEILGDLEESLSWWSSELGERKARKRVFWQVLKCIRLISLKEGKTANTSFILWLSYFRTGFRFLWKTRTYSSINIAGLGFGIASALFAILFITDQYSFDRFHSRSDNLYRLAMELKVPGQTELIGGASYIMGDVYKEKIPGIAATSRLKSGSGILINKEVNSEQYLHFSDPSLFEMFDFEWIIGGFESFGQPNQVVVSNSFFDEIGKKDQLDFNLGGKNIRLRIIGVFKDYPLNSTFKPELILPIANWKETVHERRTKTWLDINMNLIVLTKPNTDIKNLDEQLNRVYATQNEEKDELEAWFFLQPYTDVHSNTSIYTGNGLSPTISKEILWVVSIVGILCLFISSLNYSNFSIGHFLSRSKEVGVRKILGARNHFVWQQFFIETLISSFLALLIAFALAVFFLPLFSEFVSVPYGLSDLFQIKFLLGVFLVLLLSTFLSGSYPSLILSRFRTVDTLKGPQKIGGKSLASRIFLSSQLGLAIFLIIGTISINQQLNFLLDFDLGYEDQRIISIELPRTEDEKVERFKNEISKVPGITLVTANSGYNGTGLTGDLSEKGRVRHIHVDPDFVSLLGLEILEGREFNPDLSSDRTNAVIINETLKNMLEKENVIGETLPFSYGDLEDPKIIGVVKNYFFNSPKFDHSPLVMYLSPQYPFQEVLVKFSSSYSGNDFLQVEKVWNETFFPNPFEYSWLEDDRRRRLKSEAQMRNVAVGGALIAILLVVFGLTSVLGSYVQQRMKEIVIRKISGSRLSDIFLLFSRRFWYWLILGFLIGSWPAYFFLSNWLNDYPLRIELEYWIALLALGICFGIFLITLIFQLLKVRNLNPVYFLKED